MGLQRDEVSKLFKYDPETGELANVAWRNGLAKGRRLAGSVCRFKENNVYRTVSIANKSYPVHRIAWLLMTGEMPNGHIDHINGDGLDNRWSNLRLATHAQNRANSRRQKNNTSGFKGVVWDKARGKWIAAIRADGKGIYLGRFNTPEAAHAAYVAAAERHFGSFARTE